jgi:hypothetical protein
LTTAALPATQPLITFNWKDGAWALAIFVLAAGQLLIGTDPYFTLLVVGFTILWLMSVKLCGGIKTLTGITVGYLGFQHLVCSQFAKLIFGQRPDTPLLQPILTMEVYFVGILATFLACLLAQLPCFTKIRPILPAQITADRLRVIAYLSVALMILRYMGSPQLGVGGIRFLMNFDFITPMAAASVTAYQMLKTEGKKFIHPLTYFCVGVPFLIAIIGFQRKEAIYSIVIIFAVAVAYGFRFKAVHFLAGIGLLYFFQFVFFPFALYYRSEVKRTNDLARNLSMAWEALGDVIANPMEYQKEEKFRPTSYDATRLLYYDQRPSPTLDRLTTVIITDALVHVGKMQGTYGWKTIAYGFDMVVPRIFNEDKPILGTSNLIARMAPGMVGPEDYGTQITMGYFGEGYLSFRMAGVFGISFVTMFVFLVLSRIMFGDAFRNNLWVCAWVVTVPWTVSESPVQLIIIMVFQAMPLFVALGLLFLMLANSMSRTPDPDRDTLPEKPVFEEEGLRMAG